MYDDEIAQGFRLQEARLASLETAPGSLDDILPQRLTVSDWDFAEVSGTAETAGGPIIVDDFWSDLSGPHFGSEGSGGGDDGPVTEVEEVIVTGPKPDKGDDDEEVDGFNPGDPIPDPNTGGDPPPSPGDGSSGGTGSGPTTDGEPQEKDCEADEQARAALALFLQDAAAKGEFFGVRERGAFIIRYDDGSYGLSGFEVGPSVFSAEGAQVALNEAGVTPQNVVGFVHNHPSSATLSDPDKRIIASFQREMFDAGRTDEFRMYLITNDEKIHVYDDDNKNDVRGVEVTREC